VLRTGDRSLICAGQAVIIPWFWCFRFDYGIRVVVGAALEATQTVAQTPDLLWQPLCTVVHSALASAISAALDRGTRGVNKVWQMIGPSIVQFADARPFPNVNTPEDVPVWRQGAARACVVNDAGRRC